MAITKRELDAVVGRINALMNRPTEPYVKVVAQDGAVTHAAQIGNFHLSGAYGGYALHEMVNQGGGVRDVFSGHMPKRELYERMHAFIRGIEAGRES